MAPTPVAVTGTYTNANSLFSGSLPASGGVDAAYTGPWAITEQGLHIEYVRFPQVYHAQPSDWNSFSLSAPTQNYFNETLAGTTLIYKVDAYVRKYKDYNTYSTSAYTRNQKFSILATSADINGDTYGDLSAGPDLCLGPQGSIVTEIPYYRREVWDDDVDVEYEYDTSTGGFNRAYFEASAPFCEDAEFWWKNQLVNAVYGSPDNLGNPSPLDKAHSGPHVWIPNGYSPDKETDLKTKYFIDQVGSYLRNTGFFNARPEKGIEGWPIATVRITEYNLTYHDWT